jgi:hypothetical protein
MFSSNDFKKSTIKPKIIQFDTLTKISNIQEEDNFFCFWVRRKNYPYFTAFVYNYEGIQLFNYTLKNSAIKNVGLFADKNIFYIIVSGGEGGYGYKAAQDSIKAFNIDSGKLSWVATSAAHRYELSPNRKFIVGTSPHMSIQTQYDLINLNNGYKVEIPGRPSLITIKDDNSLIFIKSQANYCTPGPLSLSIYDIPSESIILEKELSFTNDLVLSPDPPSTIHIDSDENIYMTAEYRDRNNGIRNAILKFDKEVTWVWTKDIRFKRMSIISFRDTSYILASNGKDIKLIDKKLGNHNSPDSLFSSLENIVNIDRYIPRNWLSNYIIVPKRLKVNCNKSSIEILE